MQPETASLSSRPAPSHEGFRRFFNPQSVAVVGASEGQSRSDNIVQTLLQANVGVYLVNPARSTAYGRDAAQSLSAIGPVDAVVSLVNAERSIEVVKEARACGAGGVVVIAGGFRETGAAGRERETRLVSAASGELLLCGPNCNGFVNARRNIRLCGSPPIPVRSGSIGLVTHSGGFIAFAMLAARERALGFSYLVSAGNEAMLDLVDYFEFLIDDPDTRTICLVIERIERPSPFLAAAERARLAGKPVIALRLAQGDRARAIARSHTGAIVSDGGSLDAAFGSLGIIPVSSLDDMLDATVCFEQLDSRRWQAVKGVAVLTASGGAAAMASDFLEGQQLPLPPLEGLRDSVKELGEAAVTNPVDLTGFVIARPELLDNVLNECLRQPDVDVVVLLRGLDEYFRTFGGAVFDHFIDAAGSTDKALVLASIVEARIADWVDEIPAGCVARARGLGGLVTALKAMSAFTQARQLAPRQMQPLTEYPRPAGTPIPSPIGPILPFEAAMQLLKTIGVSVANHDVIRERDDASRRYPAGQSLCVVKIADAAHRTDIGGVRLGVSSTRFDACVAELRALAAAKGMPGDIVVQPHLIGAAEAFVGYDSTAEFGPVIVCGVGGVAVERNKKARSARLAPLTRADAMAMLKEIDAEAGVLTEHRGRIPWQADRMVEVLMAVGRLAGTPWIRSLDINPLVIVDSEPVAVDALCAVQAVNSQSQE